MKRHVGFVTGGYAQSLALIAAVGLLWRLVYLYITRDLPLLGDGFAYRLEADRLASGTVQGPLHPPAWTFVMALPPLLGLDSIVYQRLLTVLIGTATIVMIGVVGRSIGGPRVGLIAAGIAAAYPGMWLYERELVSEPLTMLAIATFIWVVFRFRRTPSTAGAVVLGACLGLLALIRSELILVSVIIVVPLILWRVDVSPQKRVTWIALAAGTSVLFILPWAAFNATRYERPVPLSSGLGPAMAAGNCGPTYSGEKLGYYAFGCITLASGISEDPSIGDAELRHRATDYMSDHPAEAVLVASARVGRTFNVYRPFQQARLETERGSPLWATRAALLSYWAIAGAAVAGVVIARRRNVPLYPLVAFGVIVLLAVLPTIGSVRYRSPAEVSMVLLAAIALAELSEKWRPGSIEA